MSKRSRSLFRLFATVRHLWHRSKSSRWLTWNRRGKTRLSSATVKLSQANLCWCLPTWPPVMTAGAILATEQIGATVIHSPTAPTAARATPSFKTFRTIAQLPPWRSSACALSARRNMRILPIAASMRSPMLVATVGQRWRWWRATAVFLSQRITSRQTLLRFCGACANCCVKGRLSQ